MVQVQQRMGMTGFVLMLAVSVGVWEGWSAPAGPGIVVEGAWGRPLPPGALTGAFYMVIRNTGPQPDRLLGGHSPACGTIEFHESYKTLEGVMGMRPVGSIEVPAGGRVELKVGGLHVMCLDKRGAFTPGARIPLTLRFENSGEMMVQVTIREHDAGHHH